MQVNLKRWKTLSKVKKSATPHPSSHHHEASLINHIITYSLHLILYLFQVFNTANSQITIQATCVRVI